MGSKYAYKTGVKPKTKAMPVITKEERLAMTRAAMRLCGTFQAGLYSRTVRKRHHLNGLKKGPWYGNAKDKAQEKAA